MEVVYVLAVGELAALRMLGVIVLIGVLVSALILILADSEEGEEESNE